MLRYLFQGYADAVRLAMFRGDADPRSGGFFDGAGYPPTRDSDPPENRGQSSADKPSARIQGRRRGRFVDGPPVPHRPRDER